VYIKRKSRKAPLVLGALLATSRPGFNRKPLKETQILALPLSTQMNESIALAGGVEAKKWLPILKEQDVYIIDSVLMNKILSMRNRGDCKFFKEYVESGKVVSYMTPEQIERRKTDKAKRAVACGTKR
jgi:hypothetical protein